MTAGRVPQTTKDLFAGAAQRMQLQRPVQLTPAQTRQAQQDEQARRLAQQALQAKRRADEEAARKEKQRLEQLKIQEKKVRLATERAEQAQLAAQKAAQEALLAQQQKNTLQDFGYAMEEKLAIANQTNISLQNKVLSCETTMTSLQQQVSSLTQGIQDLTLELAQGRENDRAALVQEIARLREALDQVLALVTGS